MTTGRRHLRMPLMMLVALAAVPTTAGHAAAGPANAFPFDPGDYSLRPDTPLPTGAGPTASVSSFVGSRGEHGGAVALVSGPVAGGADIFMDAGAGRAQPWRDGPVLHGHSIAFGATTTGPADSTITLEVGAGHEGWSDR